MLESGIDLSVRELASLSCDLYSNVGGFEQDRVTAELLPYLENRARFLLSEGLRLAPGGRPFPQDEVAACLGASWDRLPGLLARLRALHAVRSAERQADFEALSIAFKRVRNIVKAQPAAALDKDKLVEPAERELAAAVRKVAALPLPASGDEAGWRVRIEALAGLRPAVDRFFDDVMVMAEDESLRRNRIALLQEIERLFLEVADIGELAPSQR
jgi:glycyl-tRNA synthetase beta chain